MVRTPLPGNLYHHELDSGIVPRAVAEIFQRIHANSKTDSFRVLVSFVEIYQEEVRDLLRGDFTPTVLRETVHGTTSIHGLCEVEVSSTQEALALLSTGTTQIQHQSGHDGTLSVLARHPHDSQVASDVVSQVQQPTSCPHVHMRSSRSRSCVEN